MKKIWILAFLCLLIISMAGCSAENSSSSVLEKAKERRESLKEKEFLKEGFFFNNEDLPENQLKVTTLEEKEEVPDDFFDRSFKLVFFGDSLTQGVGDNTNGGGFTSVVEEYYRNKSYSDGVSITNLGVRGNRTNHLLNRLERLEVQELLQSADVIFITIGGNDLMKVVRDNFLELTFSLFDREQALYAERLDTVLSEVRKYNKTSTIYIIGLFNPFYQFFQEIEELNQVVTNWNETTKSVLNEYPNTVFVPIQELFMDPDVNLLDDDQFHPNEKGYQLIGDKIVEQIMEKTSDTKNEEESEIMERE